METEIYQIRLRDASGTELPATVTLGEDLEDECTITLVFGDSLLTASAPDYFEAFCRIRVQLESQGLLPLCFAASRDVYPSGMSRSMGGGLKAYRLVIGQQARQSDLVGIFDTDEEIGPATVAEQLRFFESWLASL